MKNSKEKFPNEKKYLNDTMEVNCHLGTSFFKETKNYHL